MVFKGFLGFKYSLKMSFKLCKDDFHEWKKRNHENRGVLWRKRGENEGWFEWEKGENDGFSTVSSHEISRISE